MRIISTLLVNALILGLFTVSYAQEECHEGAFVLSPLSAQEEVQLQCLPELKMPPGYGSRDLPYMVDNSTQIYMRPAFQQDGLCCGQASSIGYNFTYEMSRERNVNASLPQNQYVTHFAWNFMNGGEGWYGVSYLHSMQILKEFGMSNVVDYGGALGYGGPKRWMSGYTQYYNSMHNRITNAYQIQVGTPDGLLVLKHWLHSHLEDSPIGGIASFYAQYMSASDVLPAGTPEAGKYVLTYFGGSANHAMTIVGYNDSIRWDYNGDGQYTNNIDINNDNVVDMKDWEIGGFKMVQSYGGGPNWGNGGYAYMMYKTVADNIGNGGIWNHCVHVLDVKQACDPKLTAKIILKHSLRKMIKVNAGISNNVNLTKPEIILGFPIFDYQGGDNFMQGGSTEADKTIEFGLDLSKLLSYINLNQPVKVFMQVIEDDPNSTHTGEIISYSIFDHTCGGTEIICLQTNVPLVNDDTTTLSVTHTFNFNRVTILDESIPPAPEGEYYSYQLTASGGTEPYIWEFDKTYAESSQAASFPQVSASQLTPSNNSSGSVLQNLDFAFPFYDSAYSNIRIYVDGYIMFDNQLYPFPYFQDDKNLFNITRNISPFMDQHQEISGSQGGGIWYEGDANSATIRWKTSLVEDPSAHMNYAVRLYPDGTIKFYYGPMSGCDQFLWIAGISDGDNFNYQITSISDKPIVQPNSCTTLLRYNYPPEMQLNVNGLFYGTPAQNYNNTQITFKVTDNNFIQTRKTFTFSSTGVIVQDSVVSGGNGIIAFGETAWMNISVFNMRPDPITDATMTVHIDDPYITLVDSTESLGTIGNGMMRLYLNAFHFMVAENVPDNHLITVQTIINSGANSWECDLFHHAFAPIVTADNVEVDDENGRLDAGDTSDIKVSVMNSGGVEVNNLYAVLSTDDPYITINDDFENIPVIAPGQTVDVFYNLTVSADCPPAHSIDFVLDMMGDGNYTVSDTFALVVGLYLEDFESGGMDLFKWGNGGTRDWVTDTYSPQEGTYCARSGVITHLEQSVMKIDMQVLTDGEISFYEHTSCENDPAPVPDYDYLNFKIDGIEMGRWDGATNWTLQQFPVTAGFHRFEWAYIKDQSINFGLDAAWVDYITFPSAIVASPALISGPGTFNFYLRPGESETAAFLLTNNAQGELDFNADISSIEPSRLVGAPAGRNIEGSYLVCNATKFNTGKVNLWNFRTYNGGCDNEWIKQIYITFPAGMDLTTSTDFTGGSGGSMFFEGPLGNGVTTHWFGQDSSGWGVVHMGETAACDVTLNILNDLQNDIQLQYEVMGEVYGGPPHTVDGSIILRNLGPEIAWLSLDTTAGMLAGGSIDSILVTVNTEGLVDGKYNAWIILEDNFGSKSIIPVTLTVDTFLEEPGIAGISHFGVLSAYPDPFSDQTEISLTLREKSDIKLEISNMQGKVIRTYSSDVESGAAWKFVWDGKDNSGSHVPAGLYLGRMIAGDQSYFVKLIHTR
jgi:hypothetical protein